MKLLINEKIDVQKWNQLLTVAENNSIFQTPAFYSYFKKLKGYEADAFAVQIDQSYKAIVVVTIQKEHGFKSYFSRRGIVYGGPLLTSTESAGYLINSVSNYYKKKLIYLETRNYNDYKAYSDNYLAEGWIYQPWLNYHLNIESKDQLKRNMSSSRWRQINKAIKSAASWREAASLEEVREFYRILKNLYVNKIRKPLFDWDFFEHFYLSNMGKYLLVLYNEKVIGGIMCPILPGKTIYEFFICGLDSEYKEQYPSVMATWAAIEYGLNNNIPKFDFMGAGQPHESYGVREFKARFGGVEVEHGRYVKVLSPILYSVGKAGLSLLAKLRT